MRKTNSVSSTHEMIRISSLCSHMRPLVGLRDDLRRLTRRSVVTEAGKKREGLAHGNRWPQTAAGGRTAQDGAARPLKAPAPGAEETTVPPL